MFFFLMTICVGLIAAEMAGEERICRKYCLEPRQTSVVLSWRRAGKIGFDCVGKGRKGAEWPVRETFGAALAPPHIR